MASAGVDPLATGADGDSLAHLVVQTSAFYPRHLTIIRLLAELGVSVTGPNRRGADTTAHGSGTSRG